MSELDREEKPSAKRSEAEIGEESAISAFSKRTIASDSKERERSLIAPFSRRASENSSTPPRSKVVSPMLVITSFRESLA